VDSQIDTDAIATEARELANSSGSIVSVSGTVDLITDGRSVVRIANGHPIMSRVTGMGCTSSALTGAFAGAGLTPFEAAVDAMAVMGVVGDIAAAQAAGPGSFQVQFLDSLYLLGKEDQVSRLRLQRS
jgi:hydroxyethylthiazole kinase